MNKRELIDTVAEKTGRTKADVTAITNAIAEAIQLAVAAGDRVTIPGFITIEAVEKKAHTARNPQTGAPIEVPAKRRPKFKAGSNFEAAVNSRMPVPA